MFCPCKTEIGKRDVKGKPFASRFSYLYCTMLNMVGFASYGEKKQQKQQINEMYKGKNKSKKTETVKNGTKICCFILTLDVR